MTLVHLSTCGITENIRRRMGHQILFSTMHLGSVLVTTLLSSCSVWYCTPFKTIIPPVILSIRGFVQFNISINYLNEKWMFHLIKSMDDRRLGGMASTADDRIKIENNVDKLEHWSKNHKMKSHRGICKVLYLDKKKINGKSIQAYL